MCNKLAAGTVVVQPMVIERSLFFGGCSKPVTTHSLMKSTIFEQSMKELKGNAVKPFVFAPGS